MKSGLMILLLGAIAAFANDVPGGGDVSLELLNQDEGDARVEGLSWDGNDLLVASGDTTRVWTLEVSVSVGEARSTFEQTVGTVFSGETMPVRLTFPTALFADPRAVNYLAVVNVRAHGLDVNGPSGFLGRADTAYVAFHDGLEALPTFYRPNEWAEHVPYGIVHSTEETSAVMTRLAGLDIEPDTRVSAPIFVEHERAADVEFWGKDVPEHVELSEDDEIMLQQVRAMTERRKLGGVQQ